MAGHVLLVEDEPSVGELVRGYLARDGWTGDLGPVRRGGARRARPAPDADRHPRHRAARHRRVRRLPARCAARSRVPILMLTARDEEPDRVVGLEVGADDYLTKPFSPRELVARMKAILRRAEPQPDDDVLELGDVMLNRETHDVTIDGELVELTAKEFDLLAYFLANPGAVLSRDVLLDRVWGVDVPGRHADGRRPRRPAPPQARPPRADPHAARQRLQGGRRLKTLRGRLFAATLRRARADADADDRDRRGPHPAAGRQGPGERARPAGRQRRASRGASRSAT